MSSQHLLNHRVDLSASSGPARQRRRRPACAHTPVPLPPLSSWRTGKRTRGLVSLAFLPQQQHLAAAATPASLPTEAKRGRSHPKGKGEPRPTSERPNRKKGGKSPRRNPRKATGSNGGCLVLLDLVPFRQWRRGRRHGSGRWGPHRRRRRRRARIIISRSSSRARRRPPPPRPRHRRVSRRSSRSTGPRPRCSPGWTRTRRPRRMSPSLSASARSGRFTSLRPLQWRSVWSRLDWGEECGLIWVLCLAFQARGRFGRGRRSRGTRMVTRSCGASRTPTSAMLMVCVRFWCGICGCCGTSLLRSH